MLKKYVVRLTEEERAELGDVIRKLKGTGQKVRRAQLAQHRGERIEFTHATVRQQ